MASPKATRQLIPGTLDDGLHLDGSGDYVVVADDPSLDINQQITLSAWIRPESRKTQYVVKKANHHSVDGFELSLERFGQSVRTLQPRLGRERLSSRLDQFLSD